MNMMADDVHQLLTVKQIKKHLNFHDALP